MRRSFIGSLIAATLATVLAASTPPQAELIIKNPGDHPDYVFEVEPHALLGYAGPFEKGKSDFGAGFRGTLILLNNGFIPSINNSVGIGFGADIFFKHGTFFIPVVMQWNFW